jgi:hypothetical protein
MTMRTIDIETANRLIDGELAGAESERFRQRMREEPELAAYVEELAGLGRALGDWRLEEAPAIALADAPASRLRELLFFKVRVPALPLAAAALAVVAFAAWMGIRGADALMVRPVPEEEFPVNLVLHSPDAGSVRVVGDFDRWGEGLRMRRIEGTAYWTARLRLPRGEYRYLFLVDGSRKVADVTADYAVEDDYGARNSVLRVGL